MELRRRSLALIPLLSIMACSTGPRPAKLRPVQAEALTDASTIRRRCQDPEGVLAGRTLCVLKDLPRAPLIGP